MTDPRVTRAPRPSHTPTRAKGAATPAAPNARPAGDNGNVSVATRVLASLRGNEGLDKVTAAQWQAVIKALDGMPAAQQAAMGQALLKQGLLLQVNRDVGEISLFGQQGAVTAEPGSGRLRVTIEGNSTVYDGTKAVETIAITPERNFAVTRGGKTQIWNPRTGQGTVDGKPIPPRWADKVEGEGPRKPWASAPANKLVQPDGDDMDPNYQKLYNDAVRATGGEVVEPLHMTRDNAPERYNCHSFATTGAHGDLADPFDKVFQPRWVNFPTYQLANGPFKRLKPDQKVHVGDVILYQKDGVPTHTGKVIAVDDDGNPTRIESKWGSYGLYQHGPFDVPGIYGEIGGFYRPDPAT
jgi:hypothetical protein